MSVLFAEADQSNKTLGPTCHHVVLDVDNDDYTLCSAPHRNVQLLGTRAFDALLDSIRLRMRRHAIMVEIHNADIENLQSNLQRNEGDEDDMDEAKKGLKMVRAQLAEANEDLDKFYETVKKDWGPANQRIIGRSPPVAFDVQPGGFTEDWAAIEDKFKDFRNFIDLGTEIDNGIFTLKMYPRDDGWPKFPTNRLLPLHDMISEELMRAPDMLDHDHEPCLLVIKNGNATGVTIGRTTGIESFVRDEDTCKSSMEWTIYNYDSKSGVFSAPGDSGSMVVDGLGRMGGILNDGSGKTESSDVTYITPMYWLWPRVQDEFPNANLHPDTAV